MEVQGGPGVVDKKGLEDDMSCPGETLDWICVEKYSVGAPH